MKKVTIYTRSDFLGTTIKTEAHLVECGRRPYAQYNSAPFAIFVPKRKRNRRGVECGYQPYLVILEGWGHDLDPASPWVVVDRTAGATVSQSRYSSCDDRWQSDFDAQLDRYLEERKPTVVGDWRYTKGCNSYDCL